VSNNIRSWEKVNYEKAHSGMAPFDGQYVLVSDCKGNIRQNRWRKDLGYPEGAWSLPYAKKVESSAMYWMPVPTPEDPQWLSADQAIQVSELPFAPGTALLIRFSAVKNTATRWLYARYARSDNRWYTVNGQLPPHLISGAMVVQEVSIFSRGALIQGEPYPIWG
jgi:hypothetical protein